MLDTNTCKAAVPDDACWEAKSEDFAKKDELIRCAAAISILDEDWANPGTQFEGNNIQDCPLPGLK